MPKGFTLIELLVSLSIIAILATIGAVSFQVVQKNARDSERREEIDSVSQALEARFLLNVGTCEGEGSASLSLTYCPLRDSFFASDAVPVDPLVNHPYCIFYNTDGVDIDTVPSWTDTCPAVSGATAAILVLNLPIKDTVNFKVCTSLEGGAVYCQNSKQ